MPAKAGTAGRGAENCACFYDILYIAKTDAVQINLLCGRDNDGAHLGVYLFSSENFCRNLHIVQSAVGAGADDNLVDCDFACFVNRFCVFGQMREGNGWSQFA